MSPASFSAGFVLAGGGVSASGEAADTASDGVVHAGAGAGAVDGVDDVAAADDGVDNVAADDVGVADGFDADAVDGAAVDGAVDDDDLARGDGSGTGGG